jgi:glycosyltransferase involved in cell wall biosynthesis
VENQKPALSIVIPTLNEAGYLPKLLASIRAQTVQGYEVIVADGGSKDATAQLAREWGAKVVTDPRAGPGAGRNVGTKASGGENLFYFDGDVELPPDFFEKALAEIEGRSLVCATWGMLASDGTLTQRVLFRFLIQIQRLAIGLGMPVAGGFAIFVTRAVFDQIGGFDEEVFQAEDHDFVGAAARLGKFGFLNTVSARVSARRWKKEGNLRLAGKYLTSIVYRARHGKVREKIFEYEFGNYDEAGGADENR